jgi:hypothetical protein
MCQITVEWPFDGVWPSHIRKVASLFAQALRMEDPLRERRKGCDLELPERLEQELRLGIPVVPLGQLLLTYSKR